ncbi:hypothetical protein [Kitasatospora phosalacinea]|uniref:Lipoprotein n=1 Tax=Kitasatospora phosalacinea TaxID=2065 RepID=A0A9W6PFR8_9ACTN|nr:hypothetical protein [Kitasatospora phosalacinea]GLW54250.1 lipoprotein [Kitasatospora phosalacinea]
MPTPRPLAAVALSALALCALTACGPDEAPKNAAAPATPSASPSPSALADLSAAEIAEKSRTAGAELTGVTITVDVPGYPGGAFHGTFSENSGGDCHGTFTIAGQGSVEIVRVGDKAWEKPDAAYLKATAPGAPDGAVGKWFATGNTAKDKAYFCDLGVQLEKRVGLNTDSSPNQGLAKGGPVQVDGAAALSLTMTDPEGSPARYDVATEGEPYLLAFDSDSGGMTVRLGDFDKPVQATAPAADQVFTP